MMAAWSSACDAYIAALTEKAFSPAFNASCGELVAFFNKYPKAQDYPGITKSVRVALFVRCPSVWC